MFRRKIQKNIFIKFIGYKNILIIFHQHDCLDVVQKSILETCCLCLNKITFDLNPGQ